MKLSLVCLIVVLTMSVLSFGIGIIIGAVATLGKFLSVFADTILAFDLPFKRFVTTTFILSDNCSSIIGDTFSSPSNNLRAS